MSKSLLIVSLFSLPASAMQPKDIAAVTAATAAYTTCTVTTVVGGPVPGSFCFLKAAGVYGAVYAAANAHNSSVKKTESKK